MNATHTLCPGCNRLVHLAPQICIFCGSLLTWKSQPEIEPKALPTARGGEEEAARRAGSDEATRANYLYPRLSALEISLLYRIPHVRPESMLESLIQEGGF